MAVEPLVLIVSWLEQVGLQGLLVKLALAPEGRPAGDSRAQLRLGQVREWERNENYRAG